ncbi:hypothetical protein [Deinococcus aestuarii]|uniref:hypothetical protein n=1 Tax=Deinococcus aestuarii TaxID=2774531 RepID=UPI001C0CF39F|nr:hypothetical protein [Deinococcus aestuarii]
MTGEAARKQSRLVCRKAEVLDGEMRALRHDAGTRMVRSGLTPRDVTRQLGHGGSGTTRP